MTFHIITIFAVLLMAVLRQSFVSFGYVLIILPHIKDGAEVLMQRNIHQDQTKHEIELEIDNLEKELKKLQKEGGGSIKDTERIDKINQDLKKHRKSLASLIGEET